MFSGIAEATGPDSGQARQLPPGGGQEGADKADDYRGQALQAGESGEGIMIIAKLSSSWQLQLQLN